jgi:hypothetical protein
MPTVSCDSVLKYKVMARKEKKECGLPEREEILPKSTGGLEFPLVIYIFLWV